MDWDEKMMFRVSVVCWYRTVTLAVVSEFKFKYLRKCRLKSESVRARHDSLHYVRASNNVKVLDRYSTLPPQHPISLPFTMVQPAFIVASKRTPVSARLQSLSSPFISTETPAGFLSSSSVPSVVLSSLIPPPNLVVSPPELHYLSCQPTPFPIQSSLARCSTQTHQALISLDTLVITPMFPSLHPL